MVKMFMDFRVKCISAKPYVIWEKKNKVYNRVSIIQVIYKSGGTRV